MFAHMYVEGTGNMVRASESACLGRTDVGCVRWKPSIPATPGLEEAVVFNFGSGRRLDQLFAWCQQTGTPLVQAATGKGSRLPTRFDYPVIVSPNLALPMRTALENLPAFVMPLMQEPDTSIELEESHPYTKVDLPSGTSLIMAEPYAIPREEIVSVRAWKKHVRLGFPKEETSGFYATHRLTVRSPGMVAQVTLHVSSRALYAKGAIKLAHWIVENRSRLENRIYHSLSELPGF